MKSLGDLARELGEACKDPGKKRRSDGKGRGRGTGNGAGPIDRKAHADAEMDEAVVSDEARKRIMAKFTDIKAAKADLVKKAIDHSPLQFRRVLGLELERARRGKTATGAFQHKPVPKIVKMIAALKKRYDDEYDRLVKSGKYVGSDEIENEMRAMHKQVRAGHLSEEVDVEAIVAEAEGLVESVDELVTTAKEAHKGASDHLTAIPKLLTQYMERMLREEDTERLMENAAKALKQMAILEGWLLEMRRLLERAVAEGGRGLRLDVLKTRSEQ